MNTHFALLLFCFFSFTAVAETPPKTAEPTETDKRIYATDNLKNDLAVIFGEKTNDRKKSELEFAAWSTELNEFLLNSDDDYSKAMTLAKMVSDIKNASMIVGLQKNQEQVTVLNDLSIQPIAEKVNQMIGQSDLSADTLEALSSICLYPELLNLCHASVLLEKRMINDSDNLQAYLHPFELAVKVKNKNSAESLIQIMASTKHSRSQLDITPDMHALIEQYIADNPIPQSAIDNMVTDYKKLSGISASKKAQLKSLMPAYMPTHIKASYKYLNAIPPYRSVLDYCKTQVEAISYCRDIARIMIQKSNSMIDKGVGHSLLIASYEAERNQAGVEAANQLNEKFKKSYECISKLVTGKYFIDNHFDPEFQKITDAAKDEYEMIIKHAELRYRELKAQGDEAAVNPESCFTKK